MTWPCVRVEINDFHVLCSHDILARYDVKRGLMGKTWKYRLKRDLKCFIKSENERGSKT